MDIDAAWAHVRTRGRTQAQAQRKKRLPNTHARTNASARTPIQDRTLTHARACVLSISRSVDKRRVSSSASSSFPRALLSQELPLKSSSSSSSSSSCLPRHGVLSSSFSRSSSLSSSSSVRPVMEGNLPVAFETCAECRCAENSKPTKEHRIHDSHSGS